MRASESESGRGREDPSHFTLFEHFTRKWSFVGDGDIFLNGQSVPSCIRVCVYRCIVQRIVVNANGHRLSVILAARAAFYAGAAALEDYRGLSSVGTRVKPRKPC